jgi:hypothetical protein
MLISKKIYHARHLLHGQFAKRKCGIITSSEAYEQMKLFDFE